MAQTKVRLGIVAGLLASASLLSAPSARAGWISGNFGAGGICANAVALNAVVGCTSYGNGFEIDEVWNDGYSSLPFSWTPILNDSGGWSAGTFITNDIYNQLWMVDSTGAVYYGAYTGDVYIYGGTAPYGKPAAAWQALDMGQVIGLNVGPFKTVAAGDPYFNADEVWGTDSNGNVYMWTGHVGGDGTGGPLANGYWFQAPAVPNGAAKVGVFAEMETKGTCNIHTPWAIDYDHNIYQYEYVNSGSCVANPNSCLGGCWVQQPGAALDITSNDYVLGTNNEVYQWNPSASRWSYLGQPSLGAGVVLTQIGSALNATGFMVNDSTRNTWGFDNP
jgi:hypothetical protein